MAAFRVLLSLCAVVSCVWAQATIGPLNTIRLTTGVPIDPAKKPVNRPICVAHAWAEDKLLLSQDYPTGTPYSFYVVEQDGGLTPWGNVNGLRDEIMLDVVPSGNLAGFVPGDLFTGNGADGMLMRITNRGQTVHNNWCDLKAKAALTANVGLLRGALHFDRYGGWGQELVVATTGGHVFSVQAGETECAGVRYIGTAGVFLEGMTVLPTESAVPGSDARWGRFAGAALIGAEQQGALWAFWSDGRKEGIPSVGARVEDLDEIPGDEKGNFFIVNYGSNAIYAVDFSQFAGHAHKVIATMEAGSFWEIIYASNTLRAHPITMNGYSGTSTEQSTFSLSGVNEILPADFSLCIDSSSGSTGTVNPIMLGHFDHGLTQISNYLLGGGSARAGMVGRAAPDQLRVMLTQDYRNQFTITIMTGTMSAPVDFSVTLATRNGLAGSPLGAGVRALVQDDGSDSIVVVASAGSAIASFSTAQGETDGVVIGPIDFVPMTTLFEIEITVTVTSGSFSSMVLADYSGGSNTGPVSGTISTRPFTSPLVLKRTHCNCGNGIIDRAEQCDNGQTPNPCCVNCLFAPPSVQCRSASLICDVPEFCTGASSTCPPDQFVPAVPQVQCGIDASSGNCSYCSGTAASCPPVASAPAACPTCTQLNNCSGHGACSTLSQPPVCICTTPSPTPYTGPTCSKPNCASLTTCGACSAHPECGWCCAGGSSGVCIEGNAQGPAVASGFDNVTCPNYQYASCVCPLGCNNGTCECGVCQCPPPMGGATCDRVIDCNGVLGGSAVYGVCGCDKGNTACLGCDGIPFGKIVDVCGVCGGDGSSCYNPCQSDSCDNCMDLEDCIYCVTADGAEQCIRPEQSGICEQTASNEAGCLALASGIDEEVAAGIAGGVIAAIIIGAIAGCLLLAGGGYGGYKYLEKYKGQVSGATSNPLYEEKEMGGFNPMAENEPSLLVGVNA